MIELRRPLRARAMEARNGEQPRKHENEDKRKYAPSRLKQDDRFSWGADTAATDRN